MLFQAVLLGCPDCPPAREARALVFSEALLVNVWYAVLPFLVVAAAIGWVVWRVERGDDDGSDNGT